jgi:L-ribulokinase
MQVYADVLGCDIWVSESKQPGALGSAVLGAAAAYQTSSAGFRAVMDGMIKPPRIKYTPDRHNMNRYDALYRKYQALSELFLKESDLMKSLGKMRLAEHEDPIGDRT